MGDAHHYEQSGAELTPAMHCANIRVGPPLPITGAVSRRDSRSPASLWAHDRPRCESKGRHAHLGSSRPRIRLQPRRWRRAAAQRLPHRRGGGPRRHRVRLLQRPGGGVGRTLEQDGRGRQGQPNTHGAGPRRRRAARRDRQVRGRRRPVHLARRRRARQRRQPVRGRRVDGPRIGLRPGGRLPDVVGLLRRRRRRVSPALGACHRHRRQRVRR